MVRSDTWNSLYFCFQLSLREDELRRCKTERDEAVLKEQTLEKNVHDLEMEAEKNKQTKDDKSRQMKLMEVTHSDDLPLQASATLTTQRDIFALSPAKQYSLEPKQKRN